MHRDLRPGVCAAAAAAVAAAHAAAAHALLRRVPRSLVWRWRSLRKELVLPRRGRRRREGHRERLRVWHRLHGLRAALLHATVAAPESATAVAAAVAAAVSAAPIRAAAVRVREHLPQPLRRRRAEVRQQQALPGRASRCRRQHVRVGHQLRRLRPSVQLAPSAAPAIAQPAASLALAATTIRGAVAATLAATTITLAAAAVALATAAVALATTAVTVAAPTVAEPAAAAVSAVAATAAAAAAATAAIAFVRGCSVQD